MVYEDWRVYGRVYVTRGRNGRFVSWHRVFGVLLGKQVAVYGNCLVNGSISSRRIEIHGQGKDLYHAVALAIDYPPKKRFLTVSAKEFHEHPFKYVGGGQWVKW